MDFNAIWQVVEPYVLSIVSALGGGTVIYALARMLMGKTLHRFSEKYDVNDMADRVAQKLSGKTVNIDVTAITEKKLDKIELNLHKQIAQMQEQTAAYKHILAQIGGAVAHFKSLTDDERQALQAAVKTLDGEYKPSAPEQIVTVKLEPIAVETEKADKPTEDDSLIRFGK